MTVLAGILIFSGLLFLGLAPAAYARVRRSRAWADEVAALKMSKVADVEIGGGLAAVRGEVESDEAVEDPLTAKPVVFYEIEVDVLGGERTLLEKRVPFRVRGEDGVAVVDPAGATDILVRSDVWRDGDDREHVAAFLKKRGLSNKGSMRIEHRRIAPGDEVLVVGSPTAEKVPAAGTGYRDGTATVPAFLGGADPLILATSTLEVFIERELAGKRSSFTGVLLIAALGLATVAAGAAMLALG